jgi:hypothetical protein
LLLCLLALACGGQRVSSIPKAAISTFTPAPIPAGYQSLYDELDTQLNEFTNLLIAQQGIELHPLTFAAELLAANSNRGEALLEQKTLTGVSVYLDSLQNLGVQGVKVNIAYPLLSPDFPRSDEYLEFYKQVARQVRLRKMKLLVGVGVVFTDPTFSNVDVDFSNLTLDSYIQAKRQHIQIILSQIQPDYLTIANEPDTESEITGLTMDVDNYQLMLNFILDGLERGSTAIGAGAGNWNDLAYIEHAVQTPGVDYIDLHIYPTDQDSLVRAFQFATTARNAHKRLVIGEAWLYKSNPEEPRGARVAEIISRDVYDFWAPLDVRFLQLLVRFAQQNGIEFISPFWSKYFFGYISFSEATEALTPRQRLEQADLAAMVNIMAGNTTQTGSAYRQLIP